MAAEEDTTAGSGRRTFNLTPKARRALSDLVDQEFGPNDTDAINRAIVLAAFLMGEVKAGGSIEVTRPNEVPVRVVFL